MNHPPLPSQSENNATQTGQTTNTQTGSFEFVLSERATGFLCPVCLDQPLKVATVMETEVCACETCGGFVVDSESFAFLVQALRRQYEGPDVMPKPMDSSQLKIDRTCPACFEHMETHPYYGPGNSVIDSCPHCQLTWLDQSELTRIERAPGRR